MTARAAFDMSGEIRLPPTHTDITRALTGNLTVSSENGRIVYANVLMQIFSVLNITEAFTGGKSDLAEEGYGYTHMFVRASIGNGVAQLSELLLDGNSLKITGEGEIVVKGANVMKGYYKDEEKTREVFTEDGYFRTGDLGILNDKGIIYIKGRSKNMILGPNGENIYPEEIEARLRRAMGLRQRVALDVGGRVRPEYAARVEFDDLEVDYEPDGSAIRGRFSPHPNVWTMFMGVYLLLAIAGLAGLSYGIVQLTLGEWPWGFLVVPASVAMFGFVYGATLIGQGLGAEQMYVMRSLVDQACMDVLSERAIEPAAERS